MPGAFMLYPLEQKLTIPCSVIFSLQNYLATSLAGLIEVTSYLPSTPVGRLGE